MYRNIFLILALLFLGLIVTQALKTYPFYPDRRLSSKPDQNFFDPEGDHFFDLGTD